MQVRPYRGSVISGWFTPEQGRWLDHRVKALTDADIALVGIYQGLNLSYILDSCRRNRIRVHAVDVWEECGDQLNGKTLTRGALRSFREHLKEARQLFESWLAGSGMAQSVRVLHRSSVEAAAEFEEGSLDFVFLDADHAYESVRQDLDAWYGKIKPGCLLAGDDWAPAKFPGVGEAVEEFAAARGLEVELEGDRLWSLTAARRRGQPRQRCPSIYSTDRTLTTASR